MVEANCRDRKDVKPSLDVEARSTTDGPLEMSEEVLSSPGTRNAHRAPFSGLPSTFLWVRCVSREADTPVGGDLYDRRRR